MCAIAQPSALKSLMISDGRHYAASRNSVFSSCFLEARFTRPLRTTPERASPQADTAELAAIAARFRAAFLAALSDERHGDPRKVTGSSQRSPLHAPPGRVGACISENAR